MVTSCSVIRLFFSTVFPIFRLFKETMAWVRLGRAGLNGSYRKSVRVYYNSIFPPLVVLFLCCIALVDGRGYDFF